MRIWLDLRALNWRPLSEGGRLAVLAAAALVLAGGLDGASAAPARSKDAGENARVTTENEAAGYRVGQSRSFAPFTAPALGQIDVSRFAFTAPGRSADQKTQTVDRGFSFTPSGSTEKGRGLSANISTRAIAQPPRAPALTAIASTAATATAVAPTTPEAGVGPSGYDVHVGVGYRGFTLSSGVSRLDHGIIGGSTKSVDLGLSYAARNWKTSVQATVERGSALPVPRSQLDERVAIQAGGALALSPSLSVGGTLRYRPAPEHPTPLDPNKDERTLLVGGALAF